MTHGTTPPGWYDDGQGAQRWWDGNGWTEHTQPAAGGQQAPEPQAPAEPEANPFDEPTRIARPGETPGTPGTPSAPSAPSTPVEGVGLGKPPAPPAPGYPQQGGYAQPGQPSYASQPDHAQQGGYPQQGQPWQSPYPLGSTATGSGGGRGKLFAIIGGVVALLLVVGIVLAVVLTGDDGDGGGSGSAEGTPSRAVEDFFDLTVDRNCDVINLFSNSYLEIEAADREESLETGRQACEESSEDAFEDGELDGCDFEVTDEQVDGETADVDWKITGCDDEASNEENTFGLVKEDGEWRLAERG